MVGRFMSWFLVVVNEQARQRMTTDVDRENNNQDLLERLPLAYERLKLTMPSR